MSIITLPSAASASEQLILLVIVRLNATFLFLVLVLVSIYTSPLTYSLVFDEDQMAADFVSSSLSSCLLAFH